VLQNSFKEIGVQSSAVRRSLGIILGIHSLKVLPVERDHLETAPDYMEKYSLLPRDAIRLSVMKSIACTDIATADSGFDRVTEVNRWTPLAASP
jgi:predicted nucleic acid-binding protein